MSAAPPTDEDIPPEPSAGNGGEESTGADGEGGYWSRLRRAEPPPPPAVPEPVAPPAEGGADPPSLGVPHSPADQQPRQPGPPSVPGQYGGWTTAPRDATAVALTPGTSVLLVCAVLAMVGSVTPWVSVSLLGHSISANGIDSGIADTIGVNGWLTFAGGVVLVVLGSLMLVTRQRPLRQLAAAVAFALLGLAIYDISRVAYDVDRTPSSLTGTPGTLFGSVSASVGWGLVLLTVAAVGAMAAALVQLRSQ